MPVVSLPVATDYCFVIPCYNHSQSLSNVLKCIESYKLTCILIDDGSSPDETEKLKQITSHFTWVTLIHLSNNQGKGAAVMAGLNYALNQGYTYAIQIDADGQHDTKIITEMIHQSLLNPHALISGCPVYDSSVPKHRLIARYITHFWVWIETLSFSIKDSMCGLRIYPLQQTCNLIANYQIGKRMDFDTDIMVRLYWKGMPSIFVPTKVTYPENGISHFRALKDNLLITWMHTRLFFGMLTRIPTLINRNLIKDTSTSHWSEIEEKKGLWGIKIILKLYQIFGLKVAKTIMFPVISYFWLTGKKQRLASNTYLKQIKQFYQNVPLVDKKQLTSFRHFQRFGDSLLDKLASWQGDINIQDIYSSSKQIFFELINNKQGIVLICSHLGDIEMCRAIAEFSHNIKINAIVFKKNAARFNQVLKEVNQASTFNLIEVDSLGPDTAILLKQKLEAGEWVAIMGDRTTSNPYQRTPKNNVIWADFLGKPAPFPKGSFVLASALGHPVYLVWGLKPNGRFQVYLEHFADKLITSRKNRQAELEKIIQTYAKRLEYYCLISPLDWFNFFDFWQLSQPDPNKLETSNKSNEK